MLYLQLCFQVYFVDSFKSRIIPALSSRCARFEFGPLPHDRVAERLHYIIEQEHMRVTEDVLVFFCFELQAVDFIFTQCKGDLRSGIHLLQNSYMIYQNEEITKESLQKITMTIPPSVIETLWNHIESCKGSPSIFPLKHIVEQIICDGYPLSNLLLMLLDSILKQTSL